MSTCKDCLHYEVCDRFTAPNETYPEVGGCRCFKDKADYVEVKHGKWIYVETDENDMAIVKCSECNTKRYGTQKYCGKCGAKMDGERKESEVQGE